MGHCIHVIVTTADVDHRLRAIYPQLRRVSARHGFVIIPVNDEFMDSVAMIQPQASAQTFMPTDETFMLLTNGFHEFLQEISRLGTLAYIETEYFGGVGGQGAAVYSDGNVLMEPEWSDSYPINRALKLIGVKRPVLGDRFSALGLGKYRCNEDLIEAASCE